MGTTSTAVDTLFKAARERDEYFGEGYKTPGSRY